MNRITQIAILAAAVALTQQAFAANANDFQVFSYYHADWSGASVLSLPGRLYVPAGYDGSQSYPLVVFFHGRGEAGTDNTGQVNGNIDNLLAAAKARKFFLFAPQSTNIYSAWQPNQATQEPDDLNMAMRQISSITTQYKIDKSRMYVTGLSYGGAAAWNAIGAYRDTFAAAVPVVAGGAYQPMSWLAGKPIWSYEALDDQFRDVGRAAVTAMDTANGVTPYNFITRDTLIYNGSSYYTNSSDLYYAGGGGNQRYTEYATGGHTNATWGRAYGEAPMYDWLLSKSQQPHGFAAGETVRMDFGEKATTVANSIGTTKDSHGQAWNSAIKYQDQVTVGVAIPFAMNTAGVRTPVTASVVTPFYGAQLRTSTAATLYDTTVTQDSWIADAAHRGQIRVSGLTPGALYSVMAFASDTDSDGSNGRMTRYTIQDAAGSQFRDLDIVNNVSTEAVFAAVVADANGSFLLTVAPTGTARYGELSALSVVAVPEPASWGLLAASLGLLHRRRR